MISKVGCVSVEHVSQIVLTSSVLIKVSWLKSPWSTLKEVKHAGMSTKQNSCSAGHLHLLFMVNWRTENWSCKIYVFSARHMHSVRAGHGLSFKFVVCFYITEKHHLISKENLFKYSSRCARHPTRAYWWHSHSGNVEQSDVTAQGTVYWKLKYFLESPWDARVVLISTLIIRWFVYYSLTRSLLNSCKTCFRAEFLKVS